MRLALIAAFAALPGVAFAVGSDDDSVPTPTETTSTCTDGMIWSDAAQKCVAPEESSLGDDVLYRAVRELAYAGRFDDTLRVLAAMSDPTDERVLTYMGFVYRSLGETERGYSYYRQAIAANPDTLLARSYMGQGFVAEGRIEEAAALLTEIRLAGGRGTWAETSLALALDTGTLSAY